MADDARGEAPGGGASDGTTRALAELVLDAPVAIHVELGTVTLPARQWAALSAGDVLETGVAIGAPIVLRVAGLAVARGELVSVDGEVGVRIQEILTGR